MKKILNKNLFAKKDEIIRNHYINYGIKQISRQNNIRSLDYKFYNMKNNHISIVI